MKFKIVELFGNMAGLFRIIALGFIIFVCWEAIRRAVGIFDFSIPRQDYETVFIKDTTTVSLPDTVIRWLERITQVPMKPETVYQYVEYPSIPSIMVNQIESDGKHIKIYTQKCGFIFGTKLVYPWVKKWQFVPPQSFIAYREYFHWDKLIISYVYPHNVVLGKSSFYILSSKLSVSPFLKMELGNPKMEWGIEGSIKLW